MGQTHFSGPVIAGDKITGESGGPNQGFVVLTQWKGITQNSTNVVSTTFNVPQNAEILDIIFDIETAFNSATSAVGSVGKTAGGTEYASGVDVKTAAGRIRPTFTAAQLAAQKNESVLGVPVTASNQNKTIVASITPTGATSAGYVTVTLIYAQQ